MEDLRVETLSVLASLTEEQVVLVLDYARSLQVGDTAHPAEALADLLEEPA